VYFGCNCVGNELRFFVVLLGKEYGVSRAFDASQDDIYQIVAILRKIKEYTEIKQDLYLVPIEVGEAIVLNNVFFTSGKATLLKESYAELDRIVAILKDNPRIEIELSGHTENRGEHKQLVKLSEDRVKAVMDYIVSKGISATRITGKGYGPDKPLADNNTEAGRMLNRRVEFKIVKK